VFAALWITISLGRRTGLPLLRGGLLVLAAIGSAATLAASGAITLGEFAGVAAAVLFGAVAVAWLTGSIAAGPGEAAGPIAVTLGSLVFIGYFYSQLTLANAVLLTISVAAAAGWLPDFWPTQQMPRAVLRFVLALFPLVVAAASAISTALANPYG
jgi:hypothetical protein